MKKRNPANFVNLDKDIAAEFAEVAFNYPNEEDNEFIIDQPDYSTNNNHDRLKSKTRTKGLNNRAVKKFQYQNGSHYRISDVTSKSFILLSDKNYILTTNSITSIVGDSSTKRIVAQSSVTSKKNDFNVTPSKSLMQTSPQLTNAKIKQPLTVTKTRLNNCTLILLNIYLLAHKASCDYDDFTNSLNHYDCIQNNFSVKSNCSSCKVSGKFYLKN